MFLYFLQNELVTVFYVACRKLMIQSRKYKDSINKIFLNTFSLCSTNTFLLLLRSFFKHEMTNSCDTLHKPFCYYYPFNQLLLFLFAFPFLGNAIFFGRLFTFSLHFLGIDGKKSVNNTIIVYRTRKRTFSVL